MRRLGALLAILLVIACSQAGPPAANKVATPSPSSAASALPSMSPAPTVNTSPQPSPSTGPPALDLPLSAVGFSCRLPISTGDGQGAFISFPAGTVSVDPQAVGLQPGGTAYYDRAFSRWLPVGRNAVSPDGKHYAYLERASGAAKVHVVDVPGGTDHAFNGPNDPNYSPWFVVLDYASNGVYLGAQYESPVIGLWILDPATGASRRVVQVSDIQAIDGNFLWLGTINPSDPNPIGSMFIWSNEVDRFDLRDGSRASWFYRPGTGISVIGVDGARHPLVRVSLDVTGTKGELAVVSDAGSPQLIYAGSAEFLLQLGGAITDSHGVWLGSPYGIYLYSAAGGLKKVSNQPGHPANGCF